MSKFQVGDEIIRVRADKNLQHTLDQQPIGHIAIVSDDGAFPHYVHQWGKGYNLTPNSTYYAFDCDYEIHNPKLENE